jgi:hypothetical protein
VILVTDDINVDDHYRCTFICCNDDSIDGCQTLYSVKERVDKKGEDRCVFVWCVLVLAPALFGGRQIKIIYKKYRKKTGHQSNS